MKHRSINPLGFLALVIGGLLSFASRAESPSAELSDLLKNEFQTRYIQPYVSGNTDEWVKVFTENAVALHDGIPAISGRAAIYDFGTRVAENFSIVRLDATIDEIRREGNWAWTRGHFDATFEARSNTAPPGVAGDRSGKFLLIWEHQPDGQWLVSLDMGNSLQKVIEPDARLYFACKACHGERGLGNEAMEAPAIAGMSPGYLARQLRNYRDGLRGHRLNDLIGRQMSLIVANFSDDKEIEELAAYIATLGHQKPLATLPTASDEAAALYAPCARCHGSRGEGSGLEGLAIAWLDDWYIRRQLRNFRDGICGYDERDAPGRQMSAAAKGLTDQEIDQLAAYIVTLSGQTAEKH